MKKRAAIHIAILAIAPMLLSAQEKGRAFSEQKNLDGSSCRGFASLSVKDPRLVLGTVFSADIRFTNKGGGAHFYNPFFCRLLPLPAEMAIYDGKKRYIGDLLSWQGGSRKSVASDDWRFIPSESYVGTSLSLRAGYVPNTSYGVKSNPLPPGEYYIQMVYYKAFVSSRPDRLIGNPPKQEKQLLREFRRTFSRDELFRSNAVKILFVKE